MLLKYAFLADTAMLDSVGKATAVGIFDNINAPAFPVRQRDMTLVALIEGTAAETDECSLTIELRDDKANRFGKFDQKIKLATTPNKSISRARIFLRIQDLPFFHAGEYEFVLFVNDRFLGRVTFTVSAKGAAEEGTRE